MIGKLKGLVDTLELDHLILDVSGVGYIIHCSSKTLAKLPIIGNSVSMLIHMQVKEDDISLYGFIETQEKQWFENLITVQGIGPKLALVILSYLAPDQLISAITERSKDTFKSISGVGPKLAERIFTELSKKAQQSYTGAALREENSSSENEVIKDALIALCNLGYNKNEVNNICKKLYNSNPNISINELIRLALRELASS